MRLHQAPGFVLASLTALAIASKASAGSTDPSSSRVPVATSKEATAKEASQSGETETTEPQSLRATLSPAALADFESAMMLWDDGDFSGARLKFQLVYSESGDARLLWNLAVCEKALRHYAKALPLVRAYLEQAGGRISVAERQEAEALAKAIENFVGPVQIESDQGGATIFVDGEEVAKTPLKKPLLLDMGDRKISVRKHGFKEATLVVRVLGPNPQDRVRVQLERDIPAATLEVRAGRDQWIWVDGSEVGRDRWEGLVSPGIHRVRVTGTGYKAQEVDADLSNGGHTSVWVVARPLDPSEKGYLWPLVGALVSATAIVAVVAYYGLKPTPTRATPTETGHLDTISVGFVRGGF